MVTLAYQYHRTVSTAFPQGARYTFGGCKNWSWSNETETFHMRPFHDQIHLRSHSFYATLKWSCFDLLCIRFLFSTFYFFAEDLKFCKVTIHLKLWNVTPFRVQEWLTLGCKCSRTLKHRRGQKTLHTLGLDGSVAALKYNLDQVKQLCFAFLPVSFIYTFFIFAVR